MNIQVAKKKLEKSFIHFKDEIKKIRGGRANPELLEGIKVSVYGSMMPINQLATVTVVDATLITLHCWDKNNVDSIKLAIEKTNMGLTAQVNGQIIKVILPPLSEESRQEFVKVVKKIAEDARVSIRMVRRECLDEFEKSSPTEDDKVRFEKELQKEVDSYNEKIETELKRKEQELLNF